MHGSLGTRVGGVGFRSFLWCPRLGVALGSGRCTSMAGRGEWEGIVASSACEGEEEFRKGFDVAHVGTVETCSDPKKVSTSPRFTQIVVQTSRRRNVSGVGEGVSPLPPTYLGAVETFLAFRVKGFDVAHMGTVETFRERFRRRPYGHRRNLF